MSRAALMKQGVAVAKSGLAVGRAEGGSSACCCGGGGPCTGLPPCQCSPSGVPGTVCTSQSELFGELVIVNGQTVSDTRYQAQCCRTRATQAGAAATSLTVRSRGLTVATNEDPEVSLCALIERREWDGSGSYDPFVVGAGITVTRRVFFQDPNTCTTSSVFDSPLHGGGPLLCVLPVFLEMYGCGSPAGPTYTYVRFLMARGRYEHVAVYQENRGFGRCLTVVSDLVLHDTQPPCPNPTGRGACCCNGQCVECWSQAECAAAHGVWKGAGSRCIDAAVNHCRPPVGRCCVARLGCTDLALEDCNALGGSWSEGTCAVWGEPCESVPPQLPPGAGRRALMFVPLIGGRF